MSKFSGIIFVMGRVAFVERTKKCAVCGKEPIEIYPSGSPSMTCANPVCKNHWLLGDPLACPFCRGRKFKKVGRSLYFHCELCHKNFKKDLREYTDESEE